MLLYYLTVGWLLDLKGDCVKRNGLDRAELRKAIEETEKQWGLSRLTQEQIEDFNKYKRASNA